MIRSAVALAILLACSGCAAVRTVDDLASTDTYAKCAAADVATTAIGLSRHRMAEGNPITRALAIKALGHVGGIVVPVIGLSILTWYALRALDEPVVTTVASGLTCFSAGRNLWIVR